MAYNLKRPCQCVLTLGKEELLDEINLKMNKNVKLICCVSEVMHPEQFATKDAWFEHVRQVWKKTEETLNKKEGLKEIKGVLPGVNEELCGEEPILPRHAFWTWSFVIAMVALVVCLC